MNQYKLFYILFFGFTFMVSAQAIPEWKAPSSAKSIANPIIDPQEYDFSIIEANYIYSKYCISCHGKNGNGDGKRAKLFVPPPADFTSERVQKQTDGEIFWKIGQGRSKMPSFEKILDEEERWFLVNYIRNLAK